MLVYQRVVPELEVLAKNVYLPINKHTDGYGVLPSQR